MRLEKTFLENYRKTTWTQIESLLAKAMWCPYKDVYTALFIKKGEKLKKYLNIYLIMRY